MLFIITLIGVYVAFAGVICWAEYKDDKNIRGNRIAFNPKTGKYAYEYKENGKSAWIEAP